MPDHASAISSDHEDVVVIGRDDVSNYNQDNILPESPETIAKIREWLNPTEYDREGCEYRKHLAAHLDGTGEWLPSLTKYQEWQNSPDKGILWIRGVPGSGKSVFAATLAQKLAAEGAPVLYFFFRQIIEANHKPISLLRDWLDQVLQYSPPLQIILKDYVEGRKPVESVSPADLWAHLRTALAQLPRVYCVVDALDEMDQGNDDFIQELANLGNWRPSSVKVLMTSRPVTAVEDLMRRKNHVEIRMDERLVDIDIATYVQHFLKGSLISESDKELIKQAVPGRANGLFLYAKLAMNSLLDSDADIQTTLQKLPLNLNQMYYDILKEHARRSGIPREDQLRILRWVTHAVRPLRLLELADLIQTTAADNSELSIKGSKDFIRSACGPLLEILPDQTISVVHHSLTEFLIGSTRPHDSTDFPILEFEATHHYLAEACLSYMLSGCLEDKDYDNYGGRRAIPQAALKFPFLPYAGENWHRHAANYDWAKGSHHQISQKIDQLLANETARYQWLGLWWPEIYYVDGDDEVDLGNVSDFHIAAFCGLADYLKTLIKRHGKPNLDVVDALGRTPIWSAVHNNQASCVQVLLQAGAVAEIDGYHGMTPLHLASQFGHSEIATLLLAAGADPMALVNAEIQCRWSTTSTWETAIALACKNGHLQTASTIFTYLQKEEKSGALYWATYWRRTHIVRRFLEDSGVNPNETYEMNPPPLFVASENGDVDTIELLIHGGATALIQFDKAANEPHVFLNGKRQELAPSPSTPIAAFCHIASEDSKSSHPMESAEFHRGFSILIQAGADVNAKSPDGMTPLHFAKTSTAIKLLLEAGADPTLESNKGLTALHTCPKSKDCLELLLATERIDINRRDSNGNSPLLCFIKESPILAMEVLNHGADCLVADFDGNGPLHLALCVESEYDETKTLISNLIDAGADPNLRNFRGETAFHMIYKLRTKHENKANNFESICSLLSDHGADINAQDSQGRTPVFNIIGYGCLSFTAQDLEIFQKSSANLKIRDYRGRNLLYETVRREVAYSQPGILNRIFQFLIEAGVPPFELDFEGNTLVHELNPSNEDSLLILKELVEIGLDIHQPNMANETPLLLMYQGENLYLHAVKSCLRLLMENSKSVNMPDSAGFRPVHFAASTSEHAVSLLQHAAADPFVSSWENLNPLHIAARYRKCNVLGMILDWMKGLDPKRTKEFVNQANTSGYTPLHYASRSGLPESVALLLDAGAEPASSYNGRCWTTAGEPWFPPILQCAFFRQERLLWGPLPDGARNERMPRPKLRIADNWRPGGRQRFGHRSYADRYERFKIHEHYMRYEEIVGMLYRAEGNPPSKCQWAKEEIFDAMEFAARNKDDYAVEVICKLYTEALGLTVSDEVPLAALMSKARRESDTHALREAYPAQSGKVNRDAVEKFLEERQYSLVEDLQKSGADFTQREGRKLSILEEFATGGFYKLLDDCCSSDSIAHLIEPLGRGFRDFMAESMGDHLILMACNATQPNMGVIRVLVEKKGVHNDNALHVLASSAGWWKAARGIPYLVSKGADVNARDKNGMTPLQVALQGNSSSNYKRSKQDAENVVRMLISLGADVNAIDGKGESCLAWAQRNDNHVKLLINHGAKVDMATFKSAISFYNASSLSVSKLKILVSAEGASSLMQPRNKSLKDLPEEQGFDERSELFQEPVLAMVARQRLNLDRTTTSGDLGAEDLIRFLMGAGACPFETYLAKSHGTRSLHDLENQAPQVLAGAKWKEDYNVKIFKEEFGEWRVCEQRVLHSILSTNGVSAPILELPTLDLELKDASGRTLLLAACRKQLQESISYETGTRDPAIPVLIDRGADPYAVDKLDRNALHHLLGSSMAPHEKLASLQDIKAIIPRLINEADALGYYPMHYGVASLGSYICYSGNKNALAWIDYVLLCGLSPGATDPLGNNLLHYLAFEAAKCEGEAAEYVLGVFKRLAAFGEDVHCQNKAGQYPIHFLTTEYQYQGRPARDDAFDLIVEALDELEVDWSVRDNKGRNLLHGMGQGSKHSFMKLVAKGVDPWAEDDEGWSPLDWVAAHGNSEVLSMFERDNTKEGGLEEQTDVEASRQQIGET